MSAAERMRRHRARRRAVLIQLTIEVDEVNTVAALVDLGHLPRETEDHAEIARALSECWARLSTPQE